jgi:hypothetical protein
MVLVRWTHPPERTIATKAIGRFDVSIIECNDYMLGFLDMDNTRYRFEARDEHGLFSAASYYRDSCKAQAAEVRWIAPDRCECLLDGAVCAKLSDNEWHVSALAR